jgi:hypothetical protein
MYTEAVIRNEDAAGDGLRVMTFSCPRTGATEETLHRPYCSKKWSIKYMLPCVGGNMFGTIMLDAVQCLKSVIQRFQSLLYSCVVPLARDTCHYVTSFVSMATAGIETGTVFIIPVWCFFFNLVSADYRIKTIAVVTGLCVGPPKSRGLDPGRGKRFFSSAQRCNNFGAALAP